MKKVFYALCCGWILFACDKPKEVAVTGTPTEPPQAEIGDARYAEIGKQGINALANGDVDGWTASYADNARFYFNGGDSLVGKEAIAAYWKDRRTNVVDKMEFKNDIWTPLKVNKSQGGSDLPGMWLLGWYQVTASYKNAGSMTQWIHTDMHFDANDKIDVVVMYLDRVPINAAMAKKK